MNLPNQPIQTYTYNELGEVVMKSLGYVNPTTWLQNVNFRYSIRGQLLNINNPACAGANDGGVTSNDSNDLFGMQMLYDGSDGNLNGGNGNTALFDGRPSAVKWMSTDASGNKSYERSYVYNYDGVARYTGEIYSERTVTGTGHFSNNVDGFDESGITYDQNGNILTLQRNSSTPGGTGYTQIDNLNYTYSTTQPNQLSTVTDGAGIQYTGAGFRNLTGSTTAYVYDPNGNLTNDYYKGLQNGYNVLNRVDNTIVTTGTSQYINYIYDASGQLVRKQEYNNNVLGTTTDYIGGFVYLTQGTGTAALSYFARPEGRVLVNGSAFTQQFIITDGQGNARISFQNNGSSVAVVKQENSYYGFGLQLLNSPVSLPPKPNKKLYNGGSEWQNDYTNGDTNLPDYYQTFNRNYDAAIGRFVQTDPYPESAESMTGYQYAGNMPTMLNDPDGDLLPMPGSHTPPPSWQPYTNYGGGVPGDIQAQQAAFLGGGTGLYGTDPGLALYFGLNSGDNIYNAGDGTSNNPATGVSLQTLQNILNSNSIVVSNNGLHYWTANNGAVANPFYNPDLPETMMNSPFEGGSGSMKHFISWRGFGNVLSDYLNEITSGNIPDVIGINLHGNIVEDVGGGVAVSAFLVTRGHKRGFYVTVTPSIRAGEDAGIYGSAFWGEYLQPGDPDPSKLKGSTIDFPTDAGETPGSRWISFENIDFINPANQNWAGFSISIGPNAGVSAGYGYAIGLWPKGYRP